MKIELLKEEEILPILASEYKKDFPNRKSKSKREVLRIIKLNTYSGWGIYENGKRIGYFFGYLDEKNKTLLFDHFAIQENIRGLGLGTKALELLLQCECFKNVDVFVGEAEDPKYAKTTAARDLAKRLLSFYARHDFFETGVCVEILGSNYLLVRMVRQESFALPGNEFAEYMSNFYKSVYGKNAKYIKLKLI